MRWGGGRGELVVRWKYLCRPIQGKTQSRFLFQMQLDKKGRVGKDRRKMVAAHASSAEKQHSVIRLQAHNGPSQEVSCRTRDCESHPSRRGMASRMIATEPHPGWKHGKIERGVRKRTKTLGFPKQKPRACLSWCHHREPRQAGGHGMRPSLPICEHPINETN